MISSFLANPAAAERQKVWNLENILARSQVLAAEIRNGSPNQLVSQVKKEPSTQAEELDRLLYSLALLETTADSRQAEEMYALAANALAKNQVRWNVSRNDFLWAELFHRYAGAQRRLGREWLASYCATVLNRRRHLARLAGEEEKIAWAAPRAQYANDLTLTGDWVRDREESADARAVADYLLSGESPLLAGLASAAEQANVRLLALLRDDDLLLRRTPLFSTLARKEEALAHWRHLAEVEKILAVKSPTPEEWIELGRSLARFLEAEDSLHSSLLLLAVAYRFSYQKKNAGLANFLLQTYTRLAEGRDPYRLAESVESVTADYLPHGRWERSRAVMNLTSEVAILLGRERLRRIFRGGRLHLSPFERQRSVEILAKELGRLKGPLMKMGQMVSYLSVDLSRDEKSLFEFLWSSAEALPFREMHKSIPAEIRARFRSIDPIPLGTGSVSQVHRAILENGEEVAAKILLPEVDRLLHHDLQLVRTLVPIARVMAPTFPVNESYDELAEKLKNEIDLRSERRALLRLKEQFRDYPDIHVPDIHPGIEEKNLLVMSLERGQTLQEFVRTASQEEKDRAGKAIVRFVVSSVRDRFFSADPHPGNYLFNQGRVTFLDFGSFVEWDARTSRAWNDLIVAFLSYDYPMFLETMERLNAVDRRATDSQLRAVFDIMAKPRPGFWNTNEVCALDHEATGAQMRNMVESFGGSSPVRMYPKFLFGMRIYLGHLQVVAKIGSRANWTELVGEIFGVKKR